MGRQSALIKKQLTEFVEHKMSQLAIRVTLLLWHDNPEDTGFSEVNWVPQIGTQFEGTAGTYEEAMIGPPDRGPQLMGLNEVGVYTLRGGVINITNNVEYIIDLNNGSSGQAPSGFVQIAMDKVVTQLSRES
jgi:hypothetical protein